MTLAFEEAIRLIAEHIEIPSSVGNITLTVNHNCHQF